MCVIIKVYIYTPIPKLMYVYVWYICTCVCIHLNAHVYDLPKCVRACVRACVSVCVCVCVIIDEKQRAGAKMSDTTGRNPTYIVLDCDAAITPLICVL